MYHKGIHTFIYNGVNHAKSSEVTVLATDGIVKKTRANRTMESLWREHFAIHVNHLLFSEYNKLYSDLILKSPTPGIIDEESKTITMGLVGGHDIQFIYNNLTKKGLETPGYDYEITGRQIGKLLHIKKIEHYKHGDLRLRHLLAGSTNPNSYTPYLGIIDLESYRPTTVEQVQFEHKKTMEKLKEVDPRMIDFVREGYDTVPPSAPQLIYDISCHVKDLIQLPKGLNMYK